MSNRNSIIERIVVSVVAAGFIAVFTAMSASTNSKLSTMSRDFRATYDRISGMSQDIAEIKATLQGTVVIVAGNSLDIKEIRVRMQELELRLDRVEQARRRESEGQDGG